MESPLSLQMNRSVGNSVSLFIAGQSFRSVPDFSACNSVKWLNHFEIPALRVRERLGGKFAAVSRAPLAYSGIFARGIIRQLLRRVPSHWHRTRWY